MKLKNCSRCGKELKNGWSYCSRCGMKLPGEDPVEVLIQQEVSCMKHRDKKLLLMLAMRMNRISFDEIGAVSEQV